MPNVGGKKFPYTRAGQKAARRYGRATGQPVGGGGNRGQGGKMNPNTPIPGRPGVVPKSRFGAKPRSLPPVPGRGVGPRRRGSLVGPGTTNSIARPRGPGSLPKRPIGGRPRKPGSGGSRVMRNPGMSGRSSRRGRGY